MGALRTFRQCRVVFLGPIADGLDSRRRESEAKQDLGGLVVHPLLGFGKERKAFALILHLRVLLGVAPQANALAQTVHRMEVILPLGVEHLQQDVALEPFKLGVTNSGILLGHLEAAHPLLF